MTNLQEKVSKTGNRMLSTEFEIIRKVGTDNDFAGSRVFKHFVVENKEASDNNEEQPKYVQININNLDRYLKAVGFDKGLEGNGGDLSILSDYLEMPFIAKLDVVENTHPDPIKREKYPLNFDIRGFARR